MLAAVGAGIYQTLEAASVMISELDVYQPDIEPVTRTARLAGWRKAIDSVLA